MTEISFDTVIELHSYLTAAAADCSPTEELLADALEAFARERNLDPAALTFAYSVLGMVNRITRDDPNLIRQIELSLMAEEFGNFDTTEVN